MPTEVVVISIGLMTSVGLSAAETAASIRSGTARFVTSALRDHRFQPYTVAEVPDEGLPPLCDALAGQPLTSRAIRMLRLATSPLQKVMAGAPRAPAKVPLFLSMPEMETRIPLDRGKFLAQLALQSPCVDSAGSSAEFSGRAGGLSAISAAVKALSEGKMKFALAGGVDSLLDLFILNTLNRDGRIKSNTNLDGFIPGEGAAFVLLAARPAAETLAIKPFASVSLAATAQEPGHLYSQEPYKGEGLAQAFKQLFAASPPPAPIAATYSSMNGESFWGKEWGMAYSRSSGQFAAGTRIYHPADAYGDIGAAAGPALVALASHGIANAYRPSPSLVYCSNDGAPRAALIVTAP